MNPQRFGSKYELIERIARGGMAEIFLARSIGEAGFEKRLVIKRILPALSDEPTFVDMFLQEARLGALLSHPNIIEIFDFGRVDHQYFIAMEFVEGRSLLELVVQAMRMGIPLPLSVLVKVASHVAEGLHFAHTATDSKGVPLSIVHRDVSPSNVLVSFNGSVKITDFGIAKASLAVHKTKAGVVKGKYSYMSPQQCIGHDVDHRTDIFSLGVILFEITTQHRLFGRRSEAETISALLNDRVPTPSSVSRGYPAVLEEIVMHCLRRNPDERYQDAWSLHMDLESYLRESQESPTAMDIATTMKQVYSAEMRRMVNRPDSEYLYEALSTSQEIEPLPSEGLTVAEIAVLVGMLLVGSGTIWIGALWALR